MQCWPDTLGIPVFVFSLGLQQHRKETVDERSVSHLTVIQCAGDPLSCATKSRQDGSQPISPAIAFVATLFRKMHLSTYSAV